VRGSKLIVLLASLLPACAGAGSSSTDMAPVRTAIEQLRSSLNSGDSTVFLSLLAEDVEVFPPGVAPLRGSAARDLFRGLFTGVTANLEPFTSEEVTVSGAWAIQRYSFRLTTTPKAGGASTTEAGSGLHVWHRGADGRWQIVKDIWTSPTPPATP
jgi:ketosteroid isomerase-like protein